MPKIGELVNGPTNYDGLIGMVQRNEIDTFIPGVRPDSVPYEPGTFLTFSEFDDSPRIYSLRTEPDEKIVLDILYLWTNFDIDIWQFFLFILILCVIMFEIIAIVLIRKVSIRKIRKRFLNSVWSHFMLFVDLAPNQILPFPSATVLWTIICLAMFYAVHMVLMGTLSTDLTVPIVAPSIESLRDLLYEPKFRKFQPVIFRQLNMYSVLKNSRPKTDERVLFERIMAHPNESIRDIDTDHMERVAPVVLGVIDSIVHEKIVIIENSQSVGTMVIHSACYVRPELVSVLKPAKDTISQSILSVLMSKLTP